MSADFTGLWKRTKLFEPRDALGPENEQVKSVYWLQSHTGLFIDIRFDPSNETYDPLILKSFAGSIRFDKSTSYLTWDRVIDYRPLGPPDVGLINFLSDDEIEEDGVLPGDDYKEIWNRVVHRQEGDFAAKVFTSTENNEAGQVGYFIVVGDIFGFTLSRAKSKENEDILNSLKLMFSESLPLDSSLVCHIKSYVTVLGNTSNWKVLYSLDPEMVGHSIIPVECRHPILQKYMQSIQWEVYDGSVPDILRVK